MLESLEASFSSRDTGFGCVEITEADLRAAMLDLGTYVDISIEDLRTLCTSAEYAPLSP